MSKNKLIIIFAIIIMILIIVFIKNNKSKKDIKLNNEITNKIQIETLYDEETRIILYKK